jgi:hypothetical protein
VNLKDEAKGASKKVIAIGISTAAMALVRWIVSRPIKRAIDRRRAKEEAARADAED